MTKISPTLSDDKASMQSLRPAELAKRAAEHPRWEVAQRLAVLGTACGFGYVSRENAELLQEQRRTNKLKFNGIREQ